MKRTIGIYLAAGSSTRMGQNKLLLPFGGTTIGSAALMSAVRSALYRVLVVTRSPGVPSWMDQELRQGEMRQRWRAAPCDDAEQGQAHSLRCGLRAAMPYAPDAVMVLLADQPLVRSTMINRLLQRFEAPDHPSYVAASHGGQPGPPVLLDESWFGDLSALEGDTGARKLLRSGDKAGVCLTFENAGWYQDVDTEADYRNLLPLATSTLMNVERE